MDIPQYKTIGKMPFLGFGLGLRPDYYEEILEQKPNLDWLEVLTENYMVPGGKPLYYLDQIRAHYPVVMHGVSLSLGSTDPLDRDYLNQLKALVARVEPVWVSDHLCWTGVNGINAHDLLPVPYTRETITHIASRIQQVQDFLGRPILIENVSSYLTYKQSEMTEWEFIQEIVKQADCYILLDINNIYVSSVNHQFNPIDYIMAMPAQRVAQIHLAGHSNHGDYIIDTHDAPVIQPVWNLYAAALQRLGPISSMIERDDNMPPFAELLAEINQARRIAESILVEEVLV
ncbi:MNIO family bufferin maturase [Legionella bozemanae]|uniref:MNIO family bufferin maturase n=1 Tax=Legionella bozemanae TaxID=447 RepID=UPI00399D2B2E